MRMHLFTGVTLATLSLVANSLPLITPPQTHSWLLKSTLLSKFDILKRKFRLR